MITEVIKDVEWTQVQMWKMYFVWISSGLSRSRDRDGLTVTVVRLRLEILSQCPCWWVSVRGSSLQPGSQHQFFIRHDRKFLQQLSFWSSQVTLVSAWVTVIFIILETKEFLRRQASELFRQYRTFCLSVLYWLESDAWLQTNWIMKSWETGDGSSPSPSYVTPPPLTQWCSYSLLIQF